MILITVGGQLPFDRLLAACDRWAETRQVTEEIVAQIGSSSFRSPRFTSHAFLEPAVLRGLVERARLIVAHAGMGSILTALEMGKSIVVMPRKAALGEHRNDHQLATARHLRDRTGIMVAYEDEDLFRALDGVATDACLTPIRREADERILSHLQKFVAEERIRRGLSGG